MPDAAGPPYWDKPSVPVAELSKGARELRARADTQLRVDPRQSRLDGALGDAEPSCHLLVRETVGDEVGHAVLRTGELSVSSGGTTAHVLQLRIDDAYEMAGTKPLELAQRLSEHLARRPPLLLSTKHKSVGEERSRSLQRDRRTLVMLERRLERNSRPGQIASRPAAPPSSAAGREARPPPKRPIGVRTGAAMSNSVMDLVSGGRLLVFRSRL